MNPVDFFDYEKMSDDLYFLGRGVNLRFNLNLAVYNDGKRQIFHKEYRYDKNGKQVVTLRRNYDYYLSLEGVFEDGKEYIIIGVRDFLRFKFAIEEAIKWFTDKAYSKLYVQSKNKLIMTSPIPTHEINNLPSGKSIRLEPVVIDYGPTLDDKQPGISITLNDPNHFVEMNVDNFMGLYYVVKDLNMVLMAQSMLAYIAPDKSINQMAMDDGTSANYNKQWQVSDSDNKQSKQSTNNKIIGRRIPKKRYIGGNNNGGTPQ